MLAFEFINFTIDIYNDSGIYIFLFLIIYSIYWIIVVFYYRISSYSLWILSYASNSSYNIIIFSSLSLSLVVNAIIISLYFNNNYLYLST